MADLATLTVQKRTSTGKGANRRLRAQGVIPAVFYTPGGTGIPVQVRESLLKKTFETVGRTSVFNVIIEDGDQKTTTPALIWDIDYYPTKNRFQHVDFFGVDLTKEVRVRVPLMFEGTPPGVKLGGVLEVFLEYLDVTGMPLDLPNTLSVDVSALELGDGLRVADLTLPDGVQSTLDAALLIVQVKDKSAADDLEEDSGEEKEEEADDAASEA